MNKKSTHKDANFSSLGRDVSKRQNGIRLKICGMKYQDNIEAVAALQPDYLGFIFYEKSARFFDGVIPELPKNIKKVGVFVNAPLEYIFEKIKKYDLQSVQLHGQESPEFCDALKRHYEESIDVVIAPKETDSHLDHVISSGVERRKVLPSSNDETLKRVQGDIEIIKVFSIKDEFDFSILEPFENVCDYFLFDTKGKLPGGNGYTFNWEELKKYPSSKPYFLSGGIGLNETDNVLSFLLRQESRYCHAIDINSKFEKEPGLKDVERLKEFSKKLSFLRLDNYREQEFN